MIKIILPRLLYSSETLLESPNYLCIKRCMTKMVSKSWLRINFLVGFSHMLHQTRHLFNFEPILLPLFLSLPTRLMSHKSNKIRWARGSWIEVTHKLVDKIGGHELLFKQSNLRNHSLYIERLKATLLPTTSQPRSLDQFF